MDNQLPQVELISSTAQGSLSTFPFSDTLDSGFFVNSSMAIAGVEVNTIDVALLILCPIFACLGVIVASLLHVSNSKKDDHIIGRFLTSIYANVANIFIGLATGLVISLFFIGAINNDVSSLARILVLTAFLGYKAPFINKIKQITHLNGSAALNNKNISSTKALPVKPKNATPQVSLNQDAVKQERLKRTRLKIAEKSS